MEWQFLVKEEEYSIKYGYSKVYHSASKIGNAIYLVGGEWDDEYGFYLYNSVWMYNLITKVLYLTIKTKGIVPFPRHSHGSTEIGNCLYVIGGTEYHKDNDL